MDVTKILIVNISNCHIKKKKESASPRTQTGRRSTGSKTGEGRRELLNIRRWEEEEGRASQVRSLRYVERIFN